jgi:hypothetical protein
MKERQLWIVFRRIVERGLELGVAPLLLRASEAIDRAHRFTRADDALRDRLTREQREDAIHLERGDLVAHVIRVPYRAHDRAPYERLRSLRTRTRTRIPAAHDLVQHPDRAGPREPARRPQEHASKHEAFLRRRIARVDALCLVDRLAQRVRRAREPCGAADASRANQLRGALVLAAHDGVTKRRRGPRIARDVETASVRIQRSRSRGATHLGVSEIGRAYAEPRAPELLAHGEEPVPELLRSGLHRRPQQREIAQRAEIAHADRATQPPEDRATAQLGPTRIRGQPPIHRETRPRSRRALDALRGGDRDIDSEAHRTIIRRRDP